MDAPASAPLRIVTADEAVQPNPQPRPVGLAVAYHPPEAPSITVITREWEPGAPLACRLCPPGKCCATRRGTCTVVVPGVVPRGELALYVSRV